MVPDQAHFEIDAISRARADAGGPYHEFLRVETLSAGLYELPAGGNDRQRPHSTDEIYHVVAGRATFVAGGTSRPVGPGSVIYVRAGVTHRFERIEENLRLLVVFAPPET